VLKDEQEAATATAPKLMENSILNVIVRAIEAQSRKKDVAV
jgi:hypothetical protein